MTDLLPVVPILVLFGLSFLAGKRLKGKLGMVLASLVLVFFVVMALVDSSHKYQHVLFAILAAAFLIRDARASS
jgi:bacteriorhodopsin